MPSHNGPLGGAGRAAAPSGGTPPASTAAPVAPTLAEVVDRVFDRFDADADGNITQAEIAAAVDPNASHTDLSARISSLVTQIDGNANGSLDKDEITAAVTALDSDASGTLARDEWPAKPAADDDSASLSLLLRGPRGEAGGHGGRGGPRGEHEPEAISDIVAQIFETLDADANASISLTELLSLVDTSDKVDLTSLTTRLFTQVDTNADQGLSADELTAALNAVDADQNGSIDPGELGFPHAWDAASIDLIGLLVHELHHEPGFGG